MTERTNDSNDSQPTGAEPVIGVHYVAGQLTQALRAAAAHVDPDLRERAKARAKSLLSVLKNLASGALRVGQRQPFADTPKWVTPEVVRGGFASGEHAAGGDWRAHEAELAKQLGATPAPSRTALNGHHLTREGLTQLAGLLASRNYRIDVPEEGALLAVRWLLERHEHATAATLIETIEPFFDRLRFYPRPSEPPLAEPTVGIGMPVLARSAHSLAEGLRKKEPSKDVETMREHYEVWAPLTDKVVALVLETVGGEPPRFEGDGPERRIAGGVPFTHLPHDFEARRAALLADITAARVRHRRCQRVHRDGELLGLLTGALASFPNLDADGRARMPARVRHRLAGFVAAHGVPGSDTHRALRASQVAGPSHGRIARVLAERLVTLVQPGEGLTREAAAAATQPITTAEQRETVPSGTQVPPHLTARLAAVEEAPLSTLLHRRVVGSGEVLATLLPQLTGPALATRFTDASARTLYAASYRAFRQRRSLLLLWLQHQVRFSELPWIAALEACADADPLPAVEETLRQLAILAMTAFPETMMPNKLVSELAALAQVARPSSSADSRTGAGGGGPPWLALVEEVASDIFMGTFSVKYLRAAQIAVPLLQSLPGGSLYNRYYGLDGERLLAMNRLEEKWGVKTCPDFDAYCLELAALPSGGNPRARNGAMIEQAAILTTHNLAVLVHGLGLRPLLDARWEGLAERALVSVLDRLERRVIPESIHRVQRMRASKTLAFGWRQAIFFLSFLDPSAQASFVAKCKTLLAARSPTAHQRFAPVLAGLERVVAGDVLVREASHREVEGCRRLLGWTVETPFLMGVTKQHS
jgi:hypothetical protein